MFRDIPECSGMFHVPGFIDGQEFERYKCFKLLSLLICASVFYRRIVLKRCVKSGANRGERIKLALGIPLAAGHIYQGWGEKKKPESGAGGRWLKILALRFEQPTKKQILIPLPACAPSSSVQSNDLDDVT